MQTISFDVGEAFCEECSLALRRFIGRIEGVKSIFGRTVTLVAKAQREEKSHFQKAVVGIGNYLIRITFFLQL